MKILDSIKSLFLKKPKAPPTRLQKTEAFLAHVEPLATEKVGVWALCELHGHFHTLVPCLDVTQGPPSFPAILIIDKTKDEVRELVGKSINWGIFRFEWLRLLEQGPKWQAFRWEELKYWLK